MRPQQHRAGQHGDEDEQWVHVELAAMHERRD